MNSDLVKEINGIHEVNEESFKKQIEKEYGELFKGIGLMKSEISITLKKGAIPHVEPVRRVPHAIQEALKAELEKIVKEVILYKVDFQSQLNG